jgi:hypothetical protein
MYMIPGNNFTCTDLISKDELQRNNIYWFIYDVVVFRKMNILCCEHWTPPPSTRSWYAVYSYLGTGESLILHYREKKRVDFNIKHKSEGNCNSLQPSGKCISPLVFY